MFKFIRTHNLYFLRVQIHLFSSSSLKPIQNSSNQHSFTVTYLINSCGLSPEKAISASKHVNFEDPPHKPDSVLAFLKHHEFTETHISKIINQYPDLLIHDTHKTILPKIEFLKSKGLSSAEVAIILSRSPYVLRRSLENIIIPSFNFYSNLLGSEGKTTAAIKRCARILWIDRKDSVIPNIKTLREAGVPNAHIMSLLTRQPRAFVMGSDGFREIVETVEKLGIDRLRVTFLLAVQALRAMNKSTWEKKVDVYQKWGCSEDEILDAFKKYPFFMMASEDKINRVMDFLVNELGWEFSIVARRPDVISMSLEKKIVPRSAVYQALLSRGLIKTNDISLITFLKFPETQFLNKVLSYKKEEGPELLRLYKEKLSLAK